MNTSVQNKLNNFTPEQAKFSVNDVVNKAWNLFGKTALFSIVAIVLYCIVVYGIQLLVGLIFPVDDSELMAISQSGSADMDELMEAINNMIYSPNYLTSSVISMLIGALVTPILYGILYLAYKADHNEVIEFGDIFYAYKEGRFGKSVLLALISTILMYIGLVLCFIPGIVLAIFLTLAIPFLLFSEASPIEAIKASFAVVSKNFGGFTLMFFVFVLLILLGFFMCCVGLLATVPIMYIIMYVLYKEVIGFEVGNKIEEIGSVNQNPYL